MEIFQTGAHGLELAAAIVSCLLTYEDFQTTCVVIFILVSTFPLALVFKLRIWTAAADHDQRMALYYFVALAEMCAQTLPLSFIQIAAAYTRNNVRLACARYVAMLPDVCIICARFLVWRRRRFSLSSVIESVRTESTFVFQLLLAVYLIHRIFMLLILAQENTQGFVMLILVHSLFGVCHSLDELNDEPFGDGRILVPFERRLFNFVTFFFIYPIMSIIIYIKILKPAKWWALFYYITILVEHICITLMYLNSLHIVAALLLLMALVGFSCHVIFSNYYSDDNASLLQPMPAPQPKIYFAY